MRISIFTPTHDTSFLQEVYDSIKEQDFFEWVIVFNGKAKPMQFLLQNETDTRVKLVQAMSSSGQDTSYVGMLKALACSKCTGDILLELDHDDLLAPTAVQEVNDAFEQHPSAGFVYSNAVRVQVQPDGRMLPADLLPVSEGWACRPCDTFGPGLYETVAFKPLPWTVARIWFAPDHLRAFRRSVYEKVGGHNPGMRVLDDQELMARMFIEAPFHHIDKALYLYRITGENSWLKHNEEIQNNVMRLYDVYIEKMTVAHYKRTNGTMVELGGRMNALPEMITVDLKDADINADLDERWPFADSSIDLIRAADVFEHLLKHLHTMKELYRVLKPGGFALIQVPSTDGRGADQDPTHVSRWNENSFKYYTDAAKAKYIDTPVRFQAVRLYTTPKDAEEVCWARAHLVCLKDGYVSAGPTRI